jgi:hypothetical protein
LGRLPDLGHRGAIAVIHRRVAARISGVACGTHRFFLYHMLSRTVRNETFRRVPASDDRKALVYTHLTLHVECSNTQEEVG